MVVRKMKDKCKDAARMRREKERAEFVELSKLLPLPTSTTSQLDKASIIRLTSSYLRMRTAFPRGLGGNWGKERAVHNHQHQQNSARLPNNLGPDNNNNHHHHYQQQQVRELGSLILQTLDGFAFALHQDGKIMYISETASVHLGLPQIDLTGSSVFEYIHPADHNDMHQILSLNETDRAQLRASPEASSGLCELGRSFCMRMKCILPKRNAGLVSNGYKAIHCSGYLKCRLQVGQSAAESTDHQIDSQAGQQVGPTWGSYALVAVGHSLLPTASTEIKLSGNSFMFRANLDLKLYYIEASVLKLLGFEQAEMIGQSLYQFVHAVDLVNLDTSHRSLLDKGQVVTKYYRLMRKSGGFVWVQSYASLVNNPRNMPKPQHVVSICFVLGDNQLDESCILRQFDDRQIPKLSPSNQSRNCNMIAVERSRGQKTVASRSLADQKLYRRDTKQFGVNKRSRKSRDFNLNQNLDHGTMDRQQTQINGNGSMRKINQQQQQQLPPTNLAPSILTTCQQGNPVNSGNLLQEHYHQHCVCTAIDAQNNPNKTIGSIRRPSDDNYSMVSSVASTCVSSASSSSSSSSHNNSDQLLGLYQLVNDSYTMNQTIPPSQAEHPNLINGSHRQLVLATPTKDIGLPMGDSHLTQYADDMIHIQHNQNHQQHQLQPIHQTMTCNEASLLEDHSSSTYNQTNYQQNYFQSSPEWQLQTSSDHCLGVTYDCQRQQQLQPSPVASCLYADTQASSGYHQELSPYFSGAGYCMSSI